MSKTAVGLCALALLWLVSLPLACCFGPYPLAMGDVWQILLQKIPQQEIPQIVVGQIRLARVLLAALVGGALAVAGTGLQGVLRNPLADPFTLGIAAGAACGASLVLAGYGAGLGLMGAGGAGLALNTMLGLAALLGALLALLCALWLGRGQGDFDRTGVVLAGIAVATFLGACVALVKALNEESVTSIVFWVLGSLQGRGWEHMPLLLATLVPGLALVVVHWRALDVLALGPEEAGQLGVNVALVRLHLLLGTSLLTAGCVAVSGVIGFVGLVVPHTLRLLLGVGHGRLLAGAFLGGGVLLVWADCIARGLLDGGQELPVGVVTAFLGGPFFAFLVRRGHGHA